MRVFVIDHQSKSHGLIQALQSEGHEIVDSLDDCEVLFAHTDDPWHQNDREIIESVGASGRKVFLYPHSGAPAIEYDGFVSPSPYVTAKLVTAPGHATVLRRYDYPRPVHAIGWFYCPLVPFRSVAKVEKILFAPIHPWADGRTILSAHLLMNKNVLTVLRELDAEVTVSFFGVPEVNGLTEDVEGLVLRPITALDNSYADIDAADLVVATGTYAYLAIARGKPTIMFTQKSPGLNDRGTEHVQNWDKYGDYMRYPLDMSDWPIDMLIAKAIAGGKWLENWKALFIGSQLRPERLTEVITGSISEYRPNRRDRRSRKERKRQRVRMNR